MSTNDFLTGTKSVTVRIPADLLRQIDEYVEGLPVVEVHGKTLRATRTDGLVMALRKGMEALRAARASDASPPDLPTTDRV
ncbi:MAG: hypothetical protein U0441_14815 [Polyangiaceae bacterium]